MSKMTPMFLALATVHGSALTEMGKTGRGSDAGLWAW